MTAVCQILNTRWRLKRENPQIRKLELLVKFAKENRWILFDQFPTDKTSQGRENLLVYLEI